MRRGYSWLVGLLGLAISASAFAEEATPTMDSGDTAWILTSTLLVLLMTAPGIGLFYGGLVRAKNMLSVLMQTFMAFSLVTVLWFLYGYSFAFTGDGPIIGTAEKVFMRGITIDTLSSVLPTVPEYGWAAFQGSFACITATLLIGGFAERIKFGAVMAFIAVWFTLSYVPQAHMVWGGGFLQEHGALDFAGGTVVHINAAVAGLVGAYFVGRRKGFGRNTMMPHSLTLTMVGASLLWIGWFGFNAGSAGAANGLAALAFVNTVCAAGAAALSWAIAETFTRGKAGMLGAASGAVAGLVVITPAAGFVGPMGAIVMGLIAGAVCLWGVTGLKRLLRVDDALDSFGVHGVGGIVGAILTGVFVNTCLGGQGSDFSMAEQVWIQFKSVIISLVWSGVVSVVTYFVIDKIWGLRVSEEEEEEGLDKASHGESAYHY